MKAEADTEELIIGIVLQVAARNLAVALWRQDGSMVAVLHKWRSKFSVMNVSDSYR